MAPYSRALRAASGVSALAMTLSLAAWSAQPSSVSSSSLKWASMVGTAPRYTSPLAPSSVMTSPSCRMTSPTLAWRNLTSTTMPSAPATQGLPMPRATTAACDVLPPRLVKTPSAAKNPWMSSGRVSSRTRITFSPLLPSLSARSASKTHFPDAAPGDAGRPNATGLASAVGSRLG